MAKDIASKPSVRTDAIYAGPFTAIFGTLATLVKWLALTLGVFILLVVAGPGFVNRELPAFIERALNAHVEGYRFTVGQATLSPKLSLEIRQLTMMQIDHPDPPVAEIPRWVLSIQWSQIFSGVLVSDYVISRPTSFMRRRPLPGERRRCSPSAVSADSFETRLVLTLIVSAGSRSGRIDRHTA